MYIHRAGRGILIKYFGIFMAIIAALALLFPDQQQLSIGLSIFLGSIYLWMMLFFRIPDRKFVIDESAVIAPADGKVVVIEKTMPDEYLKGARIQVSIFMSPFNIHINRAPISGEVSYHKYHEGKYFLAYHPKSSKENEHNTYAIKNNKTEIMLKQIAGKMARRILYYAKPGQQLNQHDEIGFIRFGSRVDLFLPLDAEIMVSLGDQVRSGQSIIAKLA